MAPEQRLAAVARRVVRECAGVRAGQSVFIEGRVDSAEYLELLAFECELVGAKPFVVMMSDDHYHRCLTELSEEQLESSSACMLAAAGAADVYLNMGAEFGRPALYSDVASSAMGAARTGRKPLFDVIFDGTKRWIGSDYPTAEQAEVFGLEPDKYFDLFWRSLDVDYARLARRAEGVRALLRGANELHVTTAKGTDLRFRIDGRPLDSDIGVLSDEAPLANLPAGEVFVAPIEDSAEGVVVFDLAFWDGRWVEDLEVEFSGGVARGVRAARGLDHFRETLASASGAGSVIGEFGIGLNHEVVEPCGNMLLDEKMLGTIHIAVGDNRMFGGTNDSSLHWDLLVLRPTVAADGRLLLEDGVLATDQGR